MPCSTVAPVPQNLGFADVSYMCCLCLSVVGELLLPPVQSSAIVLFPCCGWGLVSDGGLVWGHLGLELSDQAFTRHAVALNYRAVFLFCPLSSFCWWARAAVRPGVCPKPIAEASVRLVCVVIFPSPQRMSHFRVVLDPVGVACILPSWWPCFRWAPSKDVLEWHVCRRTQGQGALLAN